MNSKALRHAGPYKLAGELGRGAVVWALGPSQSQRAACAQLMPKEHEVKGEETAASWGSPQPTSKRAESPGSCADPAHHGDLSSTRASGGWGRGWAPRYHDASLPAQQWAPPLPETNWRLLFCMEFWPLTQRTGELGHGCSTIREGDCPFFLTGELLSRDWWIPDTDPSASPTGWSRPLNTTRTRISNQLLQHKTSRPNF